jgi:bacillithiol system protein YtxJ
MNWTTITSEEHLEKIKEESKQTPVLIFKHSTRCNISRATLDRLERNWTEEEITPLKPYFLDLLSYRSISNRIAEEFGIEHESPQAIIIHREKVVFDRSHFDIEYQQLKEAVKNQK